MAGIARGLNKVHGEPDGEVIIIINQDDDGNCNGAYDDDGNGDQWWNLRLRELMEEGEEEKRFRAVQALVRNTSVR